MEVRGDIGQQRSNQSVIYHLAIKYLLFTKLNVYFRDSRMYSDIYHFASFIV